MLSFLPVLSCQMHFCFQVSVRKQEIEDRLNSWIVFNEKNKELCAWLVQMENKVLQTADISIEEMIEKLQKVSRSYPRGCSYAYCGILCPPHAQLRAA